MSCLDWKKYMWFEHHIGDITNMPYTENTKTNIELLHEYMLRLRIDGCSKLQDGKFEHIEYTNRILRISYNTTVGLLDFNLFYIYNNSLVIQFKRKSYNVPLDKFTFGTLLVFIFNCVDEINRRKPTYDLFQILYDVYTLKPDLSVLREVPINVKLG